MNRKFILLYVLALLSGTTLFAQPAEFDFPVNCTQASTFNGEGTIFGIAAEIDGVRADFTGQDWIAAFNGDGDVIGRTVLSDGFLNGGPASVASLVIRADGGINNCPTYLDNPNLTIKIYDASADEIYIAGNSMFVATVDAGEIIGPDGSAATSDLFNFESRSFPVTFASLQARDLGGKVSIEWATASESGNDYFEVEHGTDIGSFSAVGQVAGAGDSQELIAYDLVHDTPVVGTNYYRIKQVDFEGTFSYSGIVPVEVAGTPTGEISIFPNPARDYFNLNVGNDWKVEEVNVAVFNAQGRRIIEWKQSTEVTRQVFTDDLPAGVYVLRVDGAQRSSTQRLVIE